MSEEELWNRFQDVALRVRSLAGIVQNPFPVDKDHWDEESREALRQEITRFQARAIEVISDLGQVTADTTAHLMGYTVAEETALERFERLATEFYQETGMLAPGKDSPAAIGGDDEDDRRRAEAWVVWISKRGGYPNA